MSSRLLFTCEHGGNRVPRKYAKLFRGRWRVLETHRGYDAGALELARSFSAEHQSPLIFSTVTRLLVDLNRSLHHRNVFSEFTAPLSGQERQDIVHAHYLPYRQQVQYTIAGLLAEGADVVHVSVHSFSPELEGVPRQADVGLLYDSRRELEAEFCERWRAAIRARRGDLRVRRNYPYLGKADGLTTALRRLHAEQRYIGIELEVNRGHWRPKSPAWRRLQRDLVATLAAALESAGQTRANAEPGR